MKKLVQSLSKDILLALNEEFAGKHLTGNLLNTVYVIENGKTVEIHIPAPTYDFYEYFVHGVIQPPKKGGLPTNYAVPLDASGSKFTYYWEEYAKSKGQKVGRGVIKKKEVKPRNHIGYVDKIITDGITKWVNENSLKIEVK